MTAAWRVGRVAMVKETADEWYPGLVVETTPERVLFLIPGKLVSMHRSLLRKECRTSVAPEVVAEVHSQFERLGRIRKGVEELGGPSGLFYGIPRVRRDP